MKRKMTKLVNGNLIIGPEPPDKCELCGRIEELRPYGPNGERLCFDCGMKDKKTTMAQFDKLLNGIRTSKPITN